MAVFVFVMLAQPQLSLAEIDRIDLALIPSHKFPPLAATVIGIVDSMPQPILSREGRTGPLGACAFSADQSSYRWLYLEAPAQSSGEDLDFPVANGDETTHFSNVRLANREMLKRWGIDKPYALVEVEVNRGLGSPSGADRFVATRLKVLDETSDYPINVADAVSQLRKRHASYLQKQQQTIEAQMLKVQRTALKGKQPTGPREKAEIRYVTWLSAAQRLRVSFVSRLTNGVYSYAKGADATGVGQEVNETTRYGTVFGVQLQAAYEADKFGRFLSVQEVPLQPFDHEIPPPPEGPLRAIDPPTFTPSGSPDRT